ncbi:MAG: 2TM domain-containing protein [Flavobacteriaceae bacterium]|nr:2TM domain-containing protein [Flavobacteriaceae bacterium]
MSSIQEVAKLERAKKRVAALKGFYKHLAFYIAINVFFILRRIYRDVYHGDTFTEAILDFTNYKLFFWWGVILAIHAINIFKFDFLFGKNWEERKIKEEMSKERNR